MDSKRENIISVLGRDALLVEVGSGAETHLATTDQERGRSADHQGDDLDPSEGRWDRSTMCGRTWDRMAAGADELLPLWRDPAVAPTCRACLKILDSWFPTAETPSGVHLLAAVVAEEVTQYSSAYITGVPAEHVEATRDTVRQVLRSAGYSSNTKVIDGLVHVWSHDAYEAIDPTVISARVTSAIDRAMGTSDAPMIDEPAGPRPIAWHTWVLDV